MGSRAFVVLRVLKVSQRMDKERQEQPGNSQVPCHLFHTGEFVTASGDPPVRPGQGMAEFGDSIGHATLFDTPSPVAANVI